MDAISALIGAENTSSVKRHMADSVTKFNLGLSDAAKSAMDRVSKKFELFSGQLSDTEISRIRLMSNISLKDNNVVYLETKQDIALSSRYVKELIVAGDDTLYSLSSNNVLKFTSKLNKDERKIIKDTIYSGTVGYGKDNDEVSKTRRDFAISGTTGDLDKVSKLTEAEKHNVRSAISLANSVLISGKDPFNIL